ncbi:hypothetical protein SAMN02745702_00908 [Desulfobaculum bizertense DSM 18034]|uniref:Uncharacterized protein n=1 Tax=Desulfobaculum bizertense DSM 18034 TaxID=1121442 RepID=A0A1T4VTQ2_9BACT|nr:hypothetical protein SAMN02745702_00908 [Desulfobaculum bizertense DSM 18034]
MDEWQKKGMKVPRAKRLWGLFYEAVNNLKNSLMKKRELILFCIVPMVEKLEIQGVKELENIRDFCSRFPAFKFRDEANAHATLLRKLLLGPSNILAPLPSCFAKGCTIVDVS